MEFLIISIMILTCVCNLLIYRKYSIIKKSYINFSSYLFLILIFFQLFIPALRIFFNESTIVFNSYNEVFLPTIFYCFCTTTCLFFFMYGELQGKIYPLKFFRYFRKEFSKNYKLLLIFIILFFVSIIFALIFKQFDFNSIIHDPREFYRSTRVGYGHLVYPLVLLLKLLFILGLSLIMKPLGKFLFLILMATIFSFIGSKSHILFLVLVFFLYDYYFTIAKYSKSYKISILFVGVLLSLFLFYSYSLKQGGFFLIFLNFFDYFDNYISLWNNLKNFYFGQLLVESNTYSIIPRIFYPEKPLHYGILKLSNEIFPIQGESLQGHASLSSFGRGFGDFGLFSIVYFAFIYFFHGYVIGSIIKYKSIPAFIVILAFSFLPIISFGSDCFLLFFINTAFIFILILFSNSNYRNSN